MLSQDWPSTQKGDVVVSSLAQFGGFVAVQLASKISDEIAGTLLMLLSCIQKGPAFSAALYPTPWQQQKLL
jgi:hypothetical protein